MEPATRGSQTPAIRRAASLFLCSIIAYGVRRAIEGTALRNIESLREITHSMDMEFRPMIASRAEQVVTSGLIRACLAAGREMVNQVSVVLTTLAATLSRTSAPRAPMHRCQLSDRRRCGLDLPCQGGTVNRLILVLAVLFTASCMTTDNEQRREELETTSFSQELSVCSSSCDPPTYNGQPVSCASNYTCYSDQAGAYCWTGWYWYEVHCTPATLCPNGTCDTGAGESSWSCPQDCGPPCGDGICNGSENSSSCPQDCGGGPQCGNGVCEAGEAPPQCDCPSDCAPSNPPTYCW